MASEWSTLNEREALKYDIETEAYWAWITGGESVILDLVLVVATVDGTDPEDLPPFCATTEKEQVEKLEALEVTGSVIGEVSVSISYAGYAIGVYSDGAVVVEPLGHE